MTRQRYPVGQLLADLRLVLPCVEHQITLTRGEQEAVKRLRALADAGQAGTLALADDDSEAQADAAEQRAQFGQHHWDTGC